ncbi:MAG: response regulator transcription factor [Calditrichaeota bacterium]|nr:response regulator transcription factor [Calditrichota bacterium]
MNNKINIGIVEDDTIYRETIRDIIDEHPDLNCLFAVSSAEEAHDLLEQDEIPEVLLHDIDLPRMSGIDSVKIIRHFSPSTHIIMLTIYDDDTKIFSAVLNGAEGYLLKSTSSEKLIEAIFDVSKSGAVMNPQIAAKVLKMFSGQSLPERDYGLSNREKDILQELVNGLNKKQIADTLCISFYTVETHLKNIYAKLHVHTQVDLISKVYKEKLI